MLDAIIFGVVEGLTEFLPISSTGHLILTAKLLGRMPTETLKSFEIAIQLGAILAVVVLYWRLLFIERTVMLRIALAFFPTAVFGFLFYPFVKAVLLESATVVLWSLFLGGVAIILLERRFRTQQSTNETLGTLAYHKAFLIGASQILAMIPGVSRAGATILSGMAFRLNRSVITEFSFLLAVPTMFAATALDFSQNLDAFSPGDFWFLATGFATSFLVALFAVRFLLRYIQTHTFIAFGVYRIFLAALFWLVVL